MEAAARSVGADVTPHDLRHFYASAPIARGDSVKQVQVRLGQASAVITLRTYAISGRATTTALETSSTLR